MFCLRQENDETEEKADDEKPKKEERKAKKEKVAKQKNVGPNGEAFVSAWGNVENDCASC